MIIDQLPNLASVQATDEIPVERGTTTYKTTLQKLKDLIATLLTKADIGLGNVDNVRQYSSNNPPLLYFYQQSVSVASNAEIMRITDSKITTDTVVLECTFADSGAIAPDVTWTSYNGYIAFTGTCTAATTANVALGKTN